jgi:hypothetical protein
MLSKSLCTPALIYAVFTITQILIDLYNYNINIVFSKFIALIIFTYFLNILCQNGLGPISWVIVFVPFIFTSLITLMLMTNITLKILSPAS